MKIPFLLKKFRFIIQFLILLLIWLPLFTLDESGGLLLAADQTGCEQQLEIAEEAYYNGNFDSAIQLLESCLADPSVSTAVQIKAHTILVRIYLAQDNQLQAAEHVRRILELDSSFKPTIEQEKPDFVNLVAEIRKENARAEERSQQNRKRKWVYIGAGGAAAAAVLVLVATAGGGSSGDDNNKFGNPLPEPPSFP